MARRQPGRNRPTPRILWYARDVRNTWLELAIVVERGEIAARSILEES